MRIFCLIVFSFRQWLIWVDDRFDDDCFYPKIVVISSVVNQVLDPTCYDLILSIYFPVVNKSRKDQEQFDLKILLFDVNRLIREYVTRYPLDWEYSLPGIYWIGAAIMATSRRQQRQAVSMTTPEAPHASAGRGVRVRSITSERRKPGAHYTRALRIMTYLKSGPGRNSTDQTKHSILNWDLQYYLKFTLTIRLWCAFVIIRYSNLERRGTYLFVCDVHLLYGSFFDQIQTGGGSWTPMWFANR